MGFQRCLPIWQALWSKHTDLFSFNLWRGGSLLFKLKGKSGYNFPRQHCVTWGVLMLGRCKSSVCLFENLLNLWWCMKWCFYLLLLSTVKPEEQLPEKKKSVLLHFHQEPFYQNNVLEVKLLMTAPVESFSSPNQRTVAVWGISRWTCINRVRQSSGKQCAQRTQTP